MGQSVSKSVKFKRFFRQVLIPVAACGLLAISYTNCSGGFDALETKLASQLSGPPDEQPEPVDILAPVVEVKNKPNSKIREKSATVEFEVTDDKSIASEISILCAIDSTEFANCNSPIKLNNLSVGAHFVKIKASDKAGNATGETAVEFQVTSDLPDIPRIMMVGDSITEGGNATRIRLGQLMDADGHRYLYVGSMGGNGIRHEGHGGWTTSDINNNISNWAREYKPDVVMMMIGTNDIWRRMNLNDAVNNVNSIITKILAVNKETKIYVAKILPMGVAEGSAVPGYNMSIENSMLSRIANGEPIFIVDMYTDFTPAADTQDGVHPTGPGYSKMGERWYQYFKQIYN